ncbi:hypothetical protein AD998_10245 [bacterium 336/3]|nr:hypothetical protein AD998_10245 [bacterium 336/3]
MALLGKIREKSAGVVVTVIAIGLILFVIGSDFFTQFTRGGEAKVIGKFNGKEITTEDLKTEIADIQRDIASRNQNATESQIIAYAFQVYVNKHMTQAEYEKVGITVSEEEIKAMLGEKDSMFIHPSISGEPTFQDSTTKKFSKSRLKEYIKSLKTNPVAKSNWDNFIKQNLVQGRMQQKYNALLTQTTYVTKAEAKRDYENQNSKVSAKFLHIPFSSIVDSTVKVTDAELTAYLKENKKRFKAEESRSLEYVIFSVAPSKEDSTEFAEELRKLSKELALAKNDSVFALSKSRGTERNFSYRSPKDIPDGVYSEDRPLLKGAVVGPFLNKNSYMIVKVSDIKEDSTYFARAKNLLIQVPRGAAPAVKDSLRKVANNLLEQIKKGEANFEKKAGEINTDATKNTGGDLGWFDEKTMVPQFGKAVFGATDKGIVGSVVETDYGFHIIKVTETKTNKKYKLAVVERPIIATQETTDDVSFKAQEFLLGIKSYDDFNKKVKNNPALIKKIAKKVSPNAQSVEGITANAKPLVSWAFNDAKVGEVPQQPIRIAEQGLFVIPILTAKSEKDEADLEYFREVLTNEVRNMKKRDMILAKVKAAGNVNLDEIAKKYGAGAVASEAKDITLQNPVLGNAGFTPTGVGKAFGTKKGKKTGAFSDENGVMIVEVTEQTPAAQIADYTQYKNTLLTSQKQNATSFSYQALQELYRVQDMTYRLN